MARRRDSSSFVKNWFEEIRQTDRPLNAQPPGSGSKEIRLVEYDPSWPAKFEEHADNLRGALGDIALKIEHIGSTSVPGLAAKAKIDVLVVVPDSADEDAYVSLIESAGYTLRLREPHWHEHRFFQPPKKDVNIHVVSRGSTEIGRWLRFRDRLRSNADDRRRYEQIKRELARRKWPDTNAYAAAKGAVIEEIIAGDAE